jgi:ribosomal protein S18 acetylase RimI-like enzyme
MGFSIRPVTIEDSEALSRICLLTANYGTSAEHLHHHHELPGLIYALPYVNLPTTFGFVLVFNEESGSEKEEVVGYVLGTWDTSVFIEAGEKDWYPPLRIKYPLNSPERTENDQIYISTIHRKAIPSIVILEFSPAHIHIDILPQAQRQGWGKKLIGQAVAFLSNHDLNIKGLWVGIDPRNEEGMKFYQKIGGAYYQTPDGEYFTLKFSEWKG